ncbi:MAG: hypothetical protein JNJ83_07925 [Verrucomicrobiaceae bacterium]|nr:hypothetical protein [Verrucomicrobiaceae bacterium]
MFRRFLRFTFWLLLLTVAGGVAYLFTDSFGLHWRGFILQALEEKGIHVDFQTFGFHPLDGLVAKDVKVFGDAERANPLLEVDRLAVNFDHGKLLERKLYINGFTVRHARVSLPLDSDPASRSRLNLENLSARVLLDSDKVDVISGTGEVAGVRLVISGSVGLPQRPNKLKPPEPKKPAQTPVQRMAPLHQKKAQIEAGLAFVKRFHFHTPPTLEVKLTGEAKEMEHCHGTVSFRSGEVEYDGYSCKSLQAEADYNDGLFNLRQVQVKDAVGTLTLSGTWARQSEAVEFRVQSTADLPALARTVLHTDALKEVVFYDQSPPEMTLEGRWHLGGESKVRGLELAGSLQCGRFTTRGEVFDGVSSLFGVRGSDFYLREGLLQHKSGTLAFQVLKEQQQGLKYEAALKMDPHAFLPFISKKEQRDQIERFTFDEHSSIFALVSGKAEDGNPKALVHSGRVDLQNFSYRGTPFLTVNGDIEIAGRVIVFKNIRGSRPDGQAQADSVVINNHQGRVLLFGARAQLDPVPVLKCFAPDVAKNVALYRLPPSTQLSVEGSVASRKGSPSDLLVRFDASRGTGYYPLWGKDYKIDAPRGTISFKTGVLGYDVQGSIFGKPLRASGDVLMGGTRSGYNVKFNAESFPYEVLGKDMPFENVVANVTSTGTESPFELTADLLNGKFRMAGKLDLTAKPHPYNGRIEVNGMSLQKFAQVYSPDHESEGDLTGHFTFTGKLDDWMQLKGSGAVYILNGNLYALPILGPLTPLLTTILPNPIRGYNVAREANCTFRVANGFVVTEDIEALTATFRIVSSGSIDFIKDAIDFRAQARVRGLPGLVLRPVSQLLEYKAEGSFGKPQWKPHLFGLTSGDDEGRKKPTNEELTAAQQQGDKANMNAENKEAVPPEEPVRKKTLLNLFNRNPKP